MTINNMTIKDVMDQEEEETEGLVVIDRTGIPDQIPKINQKQDFSKSPRLPPMNFPKKPFYLVFWYLTSPKSGLFLGTSEESTFTNK